jgi:hypothetical protein
MKNNYALLFLTLSITLFFNSQFSAQVNVTFKVDMSSETVSTDGVHVAGSINGWDTQATPLTKEGDTDTYSATIQLNSGWHEYKFLNGNAWGTEENAGYPCAPSNGNRYLYINDSGNDVTLVTVPFNGCNTENTGFSVTLNVDMSSEMISADGVRLAGWLNGWNGDNLSIPDVDGNIYSATLRLPTPSDYPITLEYKFINGSDWETPDANCSTVTNNNRIETISSSGQNIYNVFNGCNYTLSTDNNFFENINIYYTQNQGLVVQNKQLHKGLSLKVFDLLGKTVLSTELKGDSYENIVNLNHLNNGLFIIKVSDSSEKFITKRVLINN